MSFRRLLFLLALAAASLGRGSEILYNQVGYYANLPKYFEAAETAATTFELVDAANDGVVFSGSLAAPVTYTDAGFTVRRGNFSSWTTPGTYRLRLGDGTTSGDFQIGAAVMNAATHAALKGFYFNRSSTALEATHAGIYARPLGHPDTSVAYHSTTGLTGTAASPKGWYDAGDYGKYVVNGGYALGTLLSLYELYPEFFDDATNLPESGNGISDLLDECRWEIEWFLTMQDVDGGVFHKLTTLNFAGFVMPHQATAQRYFFAKSTTATLNFAATMAQAARIFAGLDATLAGDCRVAAEAAWAWAVAHPSQSFQNPSGVYTGQYGDGNPSDEFIWAAAQLDAMGTTAAIAARLDPAVQAPTIDSAAGWGSTRNLGYYTLATEPSSLSSVDQERIRAALLSRADGILAAAAANPIGVPIGSGEFYWGSNGNIAGKGVLLAYAYEISGDQKYLFGMQAIADYLLGRNATTYSFLTGYGSNPPLHIHHRPSGADGIFAPVPGFLAGGPNAGREDGVAYPHLEPARSYADVEASYASNEIAVNWNAPLVFLLTALEVNAAGAAIDSEPTADAYRVAAAPTVFEVAASAGVLQNDVYPLVGSGPLVAELVTPPPLGSLTFAADGSFTYEPAAGFVGQLFFTYRTRTDSTVSAPVAVALTVTPPGGSPAPAFLQTDAAVWLDATQINPQDPTQLEASGGRILRWPDRSDAQRDAVNADSATRPHYLADAGAGQPMVRFGPGSTFLAVGDIRAGAGPITAFVVSKSDSTAGDGYERLLTGYTGTGNNWEAPNWFVSRPRQVGVQPQVYDSEITSQVDTDRALRNILVGAQSGGFNAFQGDLGEVILFDRLLTSDETAQIETYLADKWGLWNTLPGDHPGRAVDPYEAWLWNFPSLSGADALPAADPNHNGLANEFEYLFGLDPTALVAAPGPTLGISTQGGKVIVSLRTWADYPSRGFSLVTSPDLASSGWDDTAIAFEVLGSVPTETPGVAVFQLTPADPADTEFFLKLRVD